MKRRSFIAATGATGAAIMLPKSVARASGTPSGTVSMTFENYSDVPLKRDWFGYSKHTPKLVTSPSEECTLETGFQSFSTEDWASSIITGDYNIWCTWTFPKPDGKSTGRFGMKIHVPWQEYGIGTPPYWYVMSDDLAGVDPQWVKAHPASEPHRWEKSIGLHVITNPIATHSSLDLTCVINPLPPARLSRTGGATLAIDWNGSDWIAVVPGTTISHTFAGEGIVEQAKSVQLLAKCMEGGINEVRINIARIFANVKHGDDMTITHNIFRTTSKLQYEGEVIFECETEEFIAEELGEAAVELLAVLL